MTEINIKSRAEMRKALAGYFATSISPEIGIADHVPGKFMTTNPDTGAINLIPPIICVTGAPTNRIQEYAGKDSGYENKFGLSARLITVYSIEGQDDWTPSMAEDLLDKMEWMVAIAIRNAVGPWRAISRNGLSVFEGPFMLGGLSLLSEIVPILVEVDDAQTE